MNGCRIFNINIVCQSKDVGGRCVMIGGECWCYHNSGIPGRAVCGYPNDYSKKYYSLAIDTNQFPKTIIETLGLKLFKSSCQHKCNCAANVCYGSGCTGLQNPACRSSQYSWSQMEAGIARCVNMEGNYVFFV